MLENLNVHEFVFVFFQHKLHIFEKKKISLWFYFDIRGQNFLPVILEHWSP